MVVSPSSGCVPATLPATRPWEPRRTFVATLGDRYGRRTLARSRDARGRTRDVRRQRRWLDHRGGAQRRRRVPLDRRPREARRWLERRVSLVRVRRSTETLGCDRLAARPARY